MFWIFFNLSHAVCSSKFLIKERRYRYPNWHDKPLLFKIPKTTNGFRDRACQTSGAVHGKALADFLKRGLTPNNLKKMKTQLYWKMAASSFRKKETPSVKMTVIGGVFPASVVLTLDEQPYEFLKNKSMSRPEIVLKTALLAWDSSWMQVVQKWSGLLLWIFRNCYIYWICPWNIIAILLCVEPLNKYSIGRVFLEH